MSNKVCDQSRYASPLKSPYFQVSITQLTVQVYYNQTSSTLYRLAAEKCNINKPHLTLPLEKTWPPATKT